MTTVQRGRKALATKHGNGDDAFVSTSPSVAAAPAAGRWRLAGEGNHVPVAADAIHDLSNMLTIVLAGLDLLRRQPLNEPARRRLDRVQWGALRAGRLTRRMAAPDPDDAEDAEDAEAGVADLNQEVAALAVTLGRGSRGSPRVAVELAPGPLPARFNVGQLGCALASLVRDVAVAGGGGIVVSTAGRGMDGLGGRPTVEVAVSATGAGLAPGAARRAADDRAGTGERGRGPGLWMMRRFAEEAGGKVEVETGPGQATRVRLVLPRAAAE